MTDISERMDVIFEKWNHTSNKCSEISKIWRSIFVLSLQGQMDVILEQEIF